MKFKQGVSFKEENGRITIEAWQYKCPFCKAFIKKTYSGRNQKSNNMCVR